MRAESQRPQLPPQHIYLYICQEGATNANPQPEAGPRVRLHPQLSPAHPFLGDGGREKTLPSTAALIELVAPVVCDARMLRGPRRYFVSGCPLAKSRLMFCEHRAPL